MKELRRAVEFATLEWVDWFNHGRLLEPIEKYRELEPMNGTAMLDEPAVSA